MQTSIHQQIVNFIDQNDGATFKEISNKFKDQGMLALLAFDELLDSQQIRQVIENKNLGTYTYKLAA